MQQTRTKWWLAGLLLLLGTMAWPAQAATYRCHALDQGGRTSVYTIRGVTSTAAAARAVKNKRPGQYKSVSCDRERLPQRP